MLLHEINLTDCSQKNCGDLNVEGSASAMKRKAESAKGDLDSKHIASASPEFAGTTLNSSALWGE